MDIEWKDKKVVVMQAGGLLLARRSERRYAEPRVQNFVCLPMIMSHFLSITFN